MKFVNTEFKPARDIKDIDKIGHEFIPLDEHQHLDRHNYLNEFATSEEKALARKNLGIVDSSTKLEKDILKLTNEKLGVVSGDEEPEVTNVIWVKQDGNAYIYNGNEWVLITLTQEYHNDLIWN